MQGSFANIGAMHAKDALTNAMMFIIKSMIWSQHLSLITKTSQILKLVTQQHSGSNQFQSFLGTLHEQL